MKYFGIVGNIGSILGFIVSIYMLKTTDESNVYLWSILAFVTSTIVFWIIFYTKPENPIARTINSKMNFTGKYYDSKNEDIDIVEGEFQFNCLSGSSISIPPFETRPEINITNPNNEEKKYEAPPTLIDWTTDSFSVKGNSSTQYGTWKWRARGKLLKRTDTK